MTDQYPPFRLDIGSPKSAPDTTAGRPAISHTRTPGCHDQGASSHRVLRFTARDPRSLVWGIVVGLLQVATPLLFWWLDSATVYALGLVVIAAVYVGFAVADGRPKVIAVESSVTFAFVVVAAAAVTGSPWLLVAGMAGHGLKDLWQHRSHFVANTRWWPPFCMVVDWVVAAIIVGEIAAGHAFRLVPRRRAKGSAGTSARPALVDGPPPRAAGRVWRGSR